MRAGFLLLLLLLLLLHGKFHPDLRVLRSGGLPAPGRWRVAGRRAGMTKTPSNILPRVRVAAGGLQERARRRGGGGQPRAAAARARLLR